MGIITMLPDHVVNKISAGEVIERPASVVKELVENALDAHTKHIVVEIKRSGKRLIRVVDTGIGMENVDAIKSIERHATSKIDSIDDLNDTVSFGFRGEALSSIAAVSELEIVTKRKEDQFATQVMAKGGTLIETHEIGASDGTAISVKDLFFNTPVRMKFLKSDRTEMVKILDIIQTISLAHQSVSFTLMADGKELLTLPAIASLKQRIRALFGASFINSLVPFEIERSHINIEGFLGEPNSALSTRSKQYFFVNNRPIKDSLLGYALLEGYREVISSKRYPIAFVFISINPTEVDVNIHPTKREVRFLNIRFIQSILTSIVRDTVGKGSIFKTNEPIKEGTTSLDNSRIKDAISSFIAKPQRANDFSFITQKTVPKPLYERGNDNENNGCSNENITVLGSIHNLYIIAEDQSGLIILDQHAAHERVLYDKLMKEVRIGKVVQQTLLFPVMIEINKQEKLLLQDFMPSLEELGFGIEEFDPQTLAIIAVPSLLEQVEIERLLRDLLGEIKDWDRIEAPRGKIEERIARIACRQAVMARDNLSLQEMKDLFHQLYSSENPLACPHGRPTTIRMNMNKLSQLFGRSG
ncbi:DNA mismatch repair endonuclease MutL [Chlamydiota bacterium]